MRIVSKGLVYGGSLGFKCNRHYTLMKGMSEIIYCQANKRWTASVPQCLGNGHDLVTFVAFFQEQMHLHTDRHALFVKIGQVCWLLCFCVSSALYIFQYLVPTLKNHATNNRSCSCGSPTSFFHSFWVGKWKILGTSLSHPILLYSIFFRRVCRVKSIPQNKSDDLFSSREMSVSRNGLLFWIKFHITHENKRLLFSTSAN